jgi:glycosyltransferase involved in cell wall biosynthesis
MAIGWLKPVERASSKLNPPDVDLILASGPPFVSFSLAQRLSDRLGRPYVLDYRDLWSRNFYRPLPAVTEHETSVLASCAKIITVSPSWGRVMDEEFGVRHKLQVITNGYDPEDLMGVKPEVFGHFAIVYAGSFRPPKRVVGPIMAALHRLTATDGHEILFHYYGKSTEHVKSEAREHGVSDRVILHGHVAREQALSALKGCNLAVVITSTFAEGRSEENGMIPAKIYESLGLRSRVLLIAPRNSDARIVLDETGLGRSFTADEIGGIASYICELIVKNRNVQASPELYSWPYMAKNLNGTLRSILSESDSHGRAANGRFSMTV